MPTEPNGLEPIEPTVCAHCETVITPDEYGRSYVLDGEESCRVCYEHGWWCERCGERCSSAMSASILTEDGEATWCNPCADYYAEYCNSCGQSCTNDHHETHEPEEVYEYGYKPYPVFHPARPATTRTEPYKMPEFGVLTDSDGRKVRRADLLYIGAEVEVESDSNTSAGVALWRDRFGSEQDCYLKEDGSLDDGFECVTHPRSLESWREFAAGEFGAFLSDLQRIGYRSWDRHNCGLHLHLSRDSFHGPAHLWRFVALIALNPVQAKRFAGRSSGYADFDSLNSGRLISKTHGNTSRHSDAVNLSNRDTVEVRIFRPSLKAATVLGAVEFCHAAHAYSLAASARDVYTGAFSWAGFVRFVQSGDYPAALARFQRVGLMGGFDQSEGN